MAIGDSGKIKIGDNFVVDASKHFNVSIIGATNWSSGLGFKDKNGEERLLYNDGLKIGTTLSYYRPNDFWFGWGNLIDYSLPSASITALPIYIPDETTLGRFSVIDPATIVTPTPRYTLLAGSATGAAVVAALGNKIYGTHQSLVIALQGGGGGGAGGSTAVSASRDGGGGGAGAFTMVLIPLSSIDTTKNFTAGAGGAGGTGNASAEMSIYGQHGGLSNFYALNNLHIFAYGGIGGLSPFDVSAEPRASGYYSTGIPLSYYITGGVKRFFIIEALPGTRGGYNGYDPTNILLDKSTRNDYITLFPNKASTNTAERLYKLHFATLGGYVGTTDRVDGMGWPGGSSWWSLGGQGGQTGSVSGAPGSNGSGGGGGNSIWLGGSSANGGDGGDGFITIMF